VLERLARGVSARRRAAAARGQAWECLDPDVLAQAIVGMWVRVLSWWVDEPSRATRAEIVRTLSHFQLHGNRPANERLDCAASNRRNARTLVLAPPLVRSSDSESDRVPVARSKTVPSPASPKPSASDRRKGRSRKPRGVPSP
jgi:hypothetical protein